MKPLQVLVITTVAICVMIIVTGLLWMPETVAQHFGRAGVPDGFASRTGYLILFVLLCTGIPAMLYASIGVLPRKFPNLTNIPNRTYWLAEERIDASLVILKRRAIELSLWTQLFMLCVHLFLIEANSHQPARLNDTIFWVVMGVAMLGSSPRNHSLRLPMVRAYWPM